MSGLEIFKDADNIRSVYRGFNESLKDDGYMAFIVEYRWGKVYIDRDGDVSFDYKNIGHLDDLEAIEKTMWFIRCLPSTVSLDGLEKSKTLGQALKERGIDLDDDLFHRKQHMVDMDKLADYIKSNFSEIMDIDLTSHYNKPLIVRLCLASNSYWSVEKGIDFDENTQIIPLGEGAFLEHW